MNKPTAITSNIVVRESGKELLIYNLKTNKAYCLNETSAPIWQLCDGKNTITEISEKLARQMKTKISEDFVWIALDQLNKDGLLEDGLESHFKGLSRREVIRKVGFASVVVFPIVSSVIAPRSSMAQSGGLANLSACSAGSECASGNCFNSRCCTAGVNNQVPLVTCFCELPGNDAPFAAITCCATGTSTQEPTFPPGFCGPGAVLFSCDSEPRCF